MKLSILTPTYNRGCLLDKLYSSILVNSNNSECEIEWLIMDDGSTDNTKQIVNGYMEERIINIYYFYQENKGKMGALNELASKATGDLIVECDSDDFFTPNAFKTIEKSLLECDDLGNIYAMVFLKCNQNKENMGNLFPGENYESTMFDLYFKEGVTGEKAIVFNSLIRKKYKYVLENNEKFSTEARMYHKMDLDYKVKCFNKTIMVCEYKKDGYSKNINKLFQENPSGYFYYFKEMFEHNMHGIKLKKMMYIYKHYILFSVLSKQNNIIGQVKGLKNKIIIAILYFPGKLFTKNKFK